MKYNNSGKSCYLFFQKSSHRFCRSSHITCLNDLSEHAKLGMGPLWAEILDNIYPFIMEGPDAYFEEMPVAPKLAVFSGHDTTIMPLLASLGENLWNETDWPPYASMFIIEVSSFL